MSFQGDVGGIGLADLLQSLARGRAGVLSLHSKDGLRATLGVEDGSLHLLPEPEEDPEGWRRFARIAWVDDPETNVDALRMEEIARARRLETLYRLLDSNTVHFRFAPGPVPKKPAGSGIGAAEQGLERPGPGRESVWCAPMQIEGMLLEYARLKDDWDSQQTTWRDVENVVLQRLDSGPMKGDVERLHRVCDGTSGLLEMSDRLGWSLRQTRNIALQELRRGALRFSTPPELLYLVQHELARSQTERAVSRLRSWLEVAPGGPLAEIDAHGFEAEWEANRLQPVIHALPARNARSFLRRLDHATPSAVLSLARWKDFVREKANDRTGQLRLIAWQLRASPDPNIPSVRDLLALARSLLRENKRFAAGSVLRIAAMRAPETAHVRLEVGQCMVQAGIAIEAVPFLLEVIRPSLEAGHSEEVLPALRSLSEALPDNREIRRLYMRARAHAVQRTLVKKHSLVTISVLLALSVGAFVQYSSHRRTEDQLQGVLALAEDPAAALNELEATFPGDPSPRITSLRAELTQRRRLAETAIRTTWTDQYNGAAVECTVGDMELGLRRALAVPAAPALRAGEEPLPLISDLYNGLAARLDAQLAQFGAKIEDTQEQRRAEERFLALLRSLEVPIGAKPPEPAREFAKRLTSMRKLIEERGETRAKDRADRTARDTLAQQDVLINTARAHEKAGDHQRALETYQRFVDTDKSGTMAGLFASEIAKVEKRVHLIADARALCEAGRQSEAYAQLKAEFGLEADTWLLPWRVTTIPSGARAKLPDGTERVTPFSLETTWNDVTELTLELDEHEPHTIHAQHPADYTVPLSRVPERGWSARGRVEAPPVAVGDDHVVVDRSGGIARLSRHGVVVWESHLSSLGGVGRAPVFLPGRPGHLLVVTEDGEVWIVDASDGSKEGPWSAGSPPIEGPSSALDSVWIRFRNGKAFRWSERLLPEEADAASLTAPAEPGQGSNSGLAILRRRTSAATTFACPWAPYTVEIGDELFTIRSSVTGERGANVRRSGEWTYVAWEAPNVSIPRGRLWISDDKGLRAFAP
ncbi:MAG: DUF4388 domain-containing protein [Planctomycetota bacterium]|nr:DUF4388 domain-containing protein [Planctomycetota bacterium]